MSEKQNAQIAPYPEELESLINDIEYRPGWVFQLDTIDRGQGSEGLTLIVTTLGYDTYKPEQGENYRVNHYFPVPPAAFDRGSWQRWLLDRLLEIEQHEGCEFFKIGETRPFAPNHGPGRDPYPVRELGTVEDAETSFRGQRDEGSQS